MAIVIVCALLIGALLTICITYVAKRVAGWIAEVKKLYRRVEKLEYRDMYYTERDAETFEKLRKIEERRDNLATNDSVMALDKRIQQLAERMDKNQDRQSECESNYYATMHEAVKGAAENRRRRELLEKDKGSI